MSPRLKTEERVYSMRQCVETLREEPKLELYVCDRSNTDEEMVKKPHPVTQQQLMRFQYGLDKVQTTNSNRMLATKVVVVC